MLKERVVPCVWFFWFPRPSRKCPRPSAFLRFRGSAVPPVLPFRRSAIPVWSQSTNGHACAWPFVSNTFRRELELHAQAGKERDVIPRFRVAAANERLKARDVVTHLEPDPDDARARIDAERAVAVEVRLRIKRRVAIRVRPSADARADEGRDQRRDIRRFRSGFDAEVILICVDLPGPRLKLVFRRCPGERADHSEVLVCRP